eukprot:5690396-Amphidinium_carterae.1
MNAFLTYATTHLTTVMQTPGLQRLCLGALIYVTVVLGGRKRPSVKSNDGSAVALPVVAPQT